MSKKLNEDFMKAIGGTRSKSGRRLSTAAVKALGVSQKQLDESFERAITAAKKTAIGPKGEFYPTSLSGKQIAKAEPALKRHITKVFKKHFKKTGDEIKAWNATLEEVGGTYSRDMPMPAFLRRHIVGAIVPEVKKGVIRKTGRKETWQVRTVEAWREPEGGWTENQSWEAGELELPLEASNRELLKAMRDQGYLKETSGGKVAVDDHGSDPPYIWITNRSTGEPIFALTLHEDEPWSPGIHARE